MQSNSRTLKTPQPISGDDGVLRLSAPTKWSELTDVQLRFTLRMLTERSSLEAKIAMLLRFCDISIKEKTVEGFLVHHGGRALCLQAWQVQELLHTFDFIDGFEDYDVRLDAVGSLLPVDVLLHGVPFKVYLAMEKYYQGFLRNKQNTELLQHLGNLLYVTEEGDYNHEMQTFSEAEGLHCFLWFSRVKHLFGKYFPHFFQPASGLEKGTELAIIEQMNIQIRALTGGDVTKEEQVFNLDCWRALTELNAKARDAADIKRKK